MKLWWPNGYGEQQLYTLNVTFSSSYVVEDSAKVFNIGFREAEVVEEELSKKNKSQ